MIIAIDGPAASGKGTLARKLAEKLNLAYLDTGSIYRALAYIAKEEKSDFKEESLVKLAKRLNFNILISEKLREEEIGALASKVSVYPKVRLALLKFQKDFAHHPERFVDKKVGGAVLDGRDIGTVVCPEADCKFFITADIETRAQRRYKELREQGYDIIYNRVLEDLKERDLRDQSRSVAPLKASEEAITMNTTELSQEEVLKKALTHVKNRERAKRNN